MTQNELSLEQRQMILNAYKVIDQESLNYINILKQHVENLAKVLARGDIEEAMRTCYLIHSQASTFGWPLATEIAGWFQKMLRKQEAHGLNEAVNELFLNSLEQIVQDEMKAESESAIALLLNIEQKLQNNETASIPKL